MSVLLVWELAHSLPEIYQYKNVLIISYFPPNAREVFKWPPRN